MDNPFLPSQVVLHVPPLPATMGKAEIEFAAALIVRASQVLGDRWQPVTAAQIGDVLKADMATERQPFALLARNPFFRPDIHAAIAAGFVSGDPKGEVGLTPKGIEALRRWVRTEAARG